MKKQLIEAAWMSLISLGFIGGGILAYAVFGEEPRQWDYIIFIKSFYSFMLCLIVFGMTFLAILVGAIGGAFDKTNHR